MKEIVYTDKAPEPIGPYSQGVIVYSTVYVSGQIPLKADTSEMVNDDIQAATKQVMENIGHILGAAGVGFHNVAKCTILLKDMNDFAAVNEVYGEYFDKEPPAREAYQVAKLPKDALVEISCFAHII